MRSSRWLGLMVAVGAGSGAGACGGGPARTPAAAAVTPPTTPRDPNVAWIIDHARAACACGTRACIAAAEREMTSWADDHRDQLRPLFADPLRAAQLGARLERVEACIAALEGGDRPGRRSEAEVNLEAIGATADEEYRENTIFPVGSVGLTPAQPCCDYPDHKCPAVEADWVGVPAWDALAFELTAPSFFQYAYQSDGVTYEARAVGDLDCDGHTVTYTLTGSAPTGAPFSTLTRPRTAD